MPDNRWIIMPIEVQRRELDAKLVVATIAASRGYKILVGHDRVVRRLARFIPKGILFDKSIGGRGDKKVYRYHDLGHLVTAMDEEATGFLVSPELFMNSRMAADTLAMTTRWFCISEEVRKKCIETYPQFSDCFVTTGLARTDTWRHPLVGMYQADADRIRNELGPFILFNSNFGVINHARGDQFVARQMRKVEGMYDAKLTKFDRFVEESTKNLEEYLKVLPKMLEWFPEHKVVVRPHPAENIDFWSSKFRSEDRIVVRDEGVVTPWILASEFMIQHGCTTGIEAEFMQHPHANYSPVPDFHHDTAMAKAFSQFVYDQDELHSVMKNAIEGGKRYEMPVQPKLEYFAAVEGKLASERIVDEFDKISFSSKPLPGWLRLLRFTPRHLASALKDVTRRAKAYSTQKFHGTSQAELMERIDFVNRTLGLNREICATEVFKNLFLVEATGNH